jgi:hypothetical protein
MVLRLRLCLFPHRHRAVAALRKSLRLHAKRVIKTRAIIFPRQSRGQFHSLRIRKLLPQLCKQRIRHLDRCLRHRVRVLEHQPFVFRKQRAALYCGNATIFSSEIPRVLLTAEPMSIQNGHPTSVATRNCPKSFNPARTSRLPSSDCSICP